MRIKTIFVFAILAVAMLMATSCSDKKSYADFLNRERQATNAYLANCRVVNEIPSDTVFETGEDAPFYRIDKEGNVYMQVIRASDRKTDKAKPSEKIYFRYMRYNLIYWYYYDTWYGDGNEDDMSFSSTYFQYGDYTLSTSSQWGYGIQLPLSFVGVESEVNVIIKSQYGLSAEISNVQPYLYHIRYFRNKI